MSKKEVHNAIVTRNQDDDLGTRLRGGVYFNAPTLFDGEFPLPAEPCFPFASANGAGMFFVPKVGDEIEVEIEAADETDDTTDVELPEPRWRCMVYSDVADIDDKFKENYPFRMGWKTNSGHMLLFDDKEGEEFVSLLSGKGHEFIMSDKEGEERIELKSKNGHTIIMDEVTNEISILHKSGAVIKLTEDKIEIINAAGTESVTLEGGKATVKSVGEFHADAPLIKLGSSPSFHATLSENIIALSDQIQVIGNLGGATSKPIVPMSSKAGTPLDPTALKILAQGNV